MYITHIYVYIQISTRNWDVERGARLELWEGGAAGGGSAVVWRAAVMSLIYVSCLLSSALVWRAAVMSLIYVSCLECASVEGCCPHA
jgi:hypothetical protein